MSIGQECQGQARDKPGTSQGQVRDKPGTYKIFDLSQGTFSNILIFYDFFLACLDTFLDTPLVQLLRF